MTDTVVISGAATLAGGEAASATPLLSVPEVVDLAIADPGTGMELVIANVTGAPLRIAIEGVGDITIPAAGRSVVPMPDEPDGPRLHLQALSPARSKVVMATVTVETSDEGPIAVGQAIGASTC